MKLLELLTYLNRVKMMDKPVKTVARGRCSCGGLMVKHQISKTKSYWRHLDGDLKGSMDRHTIKNLITRGNMG